MADASTRFINDNIDTGDLTKKAAVCDRLANPTPSPYGVWGAKGSKMGGEAIRQ